MTWTVVRHDDVRSFLERAEVWLLESEAENDLVLGIAARLESGQHAFGDPVFPATVEEGGEVVGCAKPGIAAPPRPVVPWRMLPPPSFTRGYLARGVLLWFGIHFGVAGSVAVAGGAAPVALGLVASAFLVLAVYVASAVDTRVRRDDVFLANLGVSPRASALLSAGAAAALEAVLFVAVVVL